MGDRPSRVRSQIELSRLHLLLEFCSVGLAVFWDVVGAVGKAGLRLVVGFVVTQGKVALLQVEGRLLCLVESEGLGRLFNAGSVPVLVLVVREQFAELYRLDLLFVSATI